MRLGGYVMLCVLSLAVAAYAIGVYSVLPLGAAVHPDMRPTFEAHGAALYVHVFGAAFALLLGPMQFSSRLRARRPALHRWSGRLYLTAGVLIGGLAGLFVAFNAYGGVIARTGFACLALMWLYTGWRAYRAARDRNFASHRCWMIRNFALTFAAVTLRIWIPLSFVAGVPFDVAYASIAWLCWLPNLLFAQQLVQQA